MSTPVSEVTFRRQRLGAAVRKKAAKRRKKIGKAPLRSAFRKLPAATRAKLSRARSKFMKRFGKKIAALRSSYDFPATLTGAIKHRPEYIKMVLEGANIVCEDHEDAREFAKLYLAKDPAFSNTDTGMAALLFEVKLVEFTGGLYGVFMETIVHGNEPTFMAMFEGKLRKEELERFANDIADFCTFQVMVRAGQANYEEGSVSDLTILECVAIPGAKAYKLPPSALAGGAQKFTTDGGMPGGAGKPAANYRMLPRTYESYASVVEEGGVSDTAFRVLYAHAKHESNGHGIGRAVDQNEVPWLCHEGVWVPDLETMQEQDVLADYEGDDEMVEQAVFRHLNQRVDEGSITSPVALRIHESMVERALEDQNFLQLIQEGLVQEVAKQVAGRPVVKATPKSTRLRNASTADKRIGMLCSRCVYYDEVEKGNCTILKRIVKPAQLCDAYARTAVALTPKRTVIGAVSTPLGTLAIITNKEGDRYSAVVKESLDENEKAIAKKQKAKGNKVVLVLPKKEGEPLYFKTAAQASKMSREEYPNAKIMPIDKFIKSLSEASSSSQDDYILVDGSGVVIKSIMPMKINPEEVAVENARLKSRGINGKWVHYTRVLRGSDRVTQARQWYKSPLPEGSGSMADDYVMVDSTGRIVATIMPMKIQPEDVPKENKRLKERGINGQWVHYTKVKRGAGGISESSGSQEDDYILVGPTGKPVPSQAPQKLAPEEAKAMTKARKDGHKYIKALRSQLEALKESSSSQADDYVLVDGRGNMVKNFSPQKLTPEEVFERNRLLPGGMKYVLALRSRLQGAAHVSSTPPARQKLIGEGTGLRRRPFPVNEATLYDKTEDGIASKFTAWCVRKEGTDDGKTLITIGTDHWVVDQPLYEVHAAIQKIAEFYGDLPEEFDTMVEAFLRDFCVEEGEVAESVDAVSIGLFEHTDEGGRYELKAARDDRVQTNSKLRLLALEGIDVEPLDEGKDVPPGVGPDPTKWSKADQKKVINYYAKWPLKKLRRHQDLIISQQKRAGGNVKAMKRLQRIELLLAAAVDKREFGESLDEVTPDKAELKASLMRALANMTRAMKKKGVIAPLDKKSKFDYAKKRLVSTDGKHALQWRPDGISLTRLHESLDEAYYDQDMAQAIVKERLKGKEGKPKNVLGLKWANALPINRVDALVGKYGKPQAVSEDRVVWTKGIAPFSEVMVKDEMVPHMHPKPHVDFFYASIDYSIPASRVQEVLELTESVFYDPLTERVTARCDAWAPNIVTLHLAKRIAEGSVAPNIAERMYSSMIFKGMEDPAFLEQLQESLALGESAYLYEQKASATIELEGKKLKVTEPTHLKALASKAGISMKRAMRLWGKAQLRVIDQYPNIEKKSARYYQAATGIMKKMMKLPTKPLSASEEAAECFIIEQVVTPGSMANWKAIMAAARKKPKLSASERQLKKAWTDMVEKGILAPGSRYGVGDLYQYEPIFWSGSQGTVQATLGNSVDAVSTLHEATRSTSLLRKAGINAKTGRNPVKMRHTRDLARGPQKYGGRRARYGEQFDDELDEDAHIWWKATFGSGRVFLQASSASAAQALAAKWGKQSKLGRPDKVVKLTTKPKEIDRKEAKRDPRTGVYVEESLNESEDPADPVSIKEVLNAVIQAEGRIDYNVFVQSFTGHKQASINGAIAELVDSGFMVRQSNTEHGNTSHDLVMTPQGFEKSIKLNEDGYQHDMLMRVQANLSTTEKLDDEAELFWRSMLGEGVGIRVIADLKDAAEELVKTAKGGAKKYYQAVLKGKRGEAGKLLKTKEGAAARVAMYKKADTPLPESIDEAKPSAVLSREAKKAGIAPNALKVTTLRIIRHLSKNLGDLSAKQAEKYAKGTFKKAYPKSSDELLDLIARYSMKRAIPESLDEAVSQVAKTIQQQIGRKAFVMMGAKQLLGGKKSLMWRVGKNAKGVTKVRVTLTPADEYDVEFIRIRKKKGVPEAKVLKTEKGVQVDNLRDVIENGTGLRLSL